MEIKITSCSSFDILKPISIFLSQNPSIGKIRDGPSIGKIRDNIGDESSFYPPNSTKKIQLGGEKEEEKENIAATPIYHFSKFMDKLLSRKQTEDHKNKEVYNSLFPTTKTKPEPKTNNIPKKSISLSSITTTSESESESEKKENSLHREKIKPISNPPIIKSIFIEIHTNKPDKLKAIKGTKLYFLGQRNGKCTSFV